MRHYIPGLIYVIAMALGVIGQNRHWGSGLKK